VMPKRSAPAKSLTLCVMIASHSALEIRSAKEQKQAMRGAAALTGRPSHTFLTPAMSLLTTSWASPYTMRVLSA
jgi:hypothetical protein